MISGDADFERNAGLNLRLIRCLAERAVRPGGDAASLAETSPALRAMASAIESLSETRFNVVNIAEGSGLGALAPFMKMPADGYAVIHPDADPRRNYRAIYDASGDGALIDTLIGRLARGGEIVLAGFYAEPLQFAFPPAFLREARLRIAAEWAPEDMIATRALIESGALSLAGLVTHRRPAAEAPAAYEAAFTDPDCLKMILDWSGCA